MRIFKYALSLVICIVFIFGAIYMPAYLIHYQDRSRFSLVVEVQDEGAKNVYKYKLTGSELVELASKAYQESYIIQKDIFSVNETENPEEIEEFVRLYNNALQELVDYKIIPEFRIQNYGNLVVWENRVIDINYPEIYADFYEFSDYMDVSPYSSIFLRIDKESKKVVNFSIYNMDIYYESSDMATMTQRWLDYWELKNYTNIYEEESNATRYNIIKGRYEEIISLEGYLLVEQNENFGIIARCSYGENEATINLEYTDNADFYIQRWNEVSKIRLSTLEEYLP